MSEASPGKIMICGEHDRSKYFSASDRFGYSFLSILSSASIVIARILQPSTRGFGTHEQLGLPPCLFLHYTGFPCPSCGLTTSFAHAARLDFISALATQPFGLMAFVLALLTIPISIHFTRRRIPWSEVIHSRFADRIIYALIALYLLSWLYKIAAMKLSSGFG